MVGLIPAWAGKTTLRLTPRIRVPAHPRVGGENPKRLASNGVRPGLIPAWAGKTR